MVKIDKDELRKIIEDLPDGGSISMKELLWASGWELKEMQDFLIDYTGREIKTVDHKPIERQKNIDDWVYFPDGRMSTYPVYRVSDKATHEAPSRPDIAPDRILSTSGDTVTVPIGKKFSEAYLVRLVLDSGATYAEAEDTVNWWISTGDIYEQSTRGAPIYLTIPRGLPPKERVVKSIEMHTLDHRGTTWDPLEFYEYTKRVFGWTIAEGRDYLSKLVDKDTAKYMRFRTYRLPTEIPIEVYKTVAKEHYEPKPLAMRVSAVTRWAARSGSGYKDQDAKKAKQKRTGRKYDQDHELNAFIRIPKGTTDNEMEDMALDLIQLALDAHKNPYPSVHNMQRSRAAGGWGASKPTLNTTAMEEADGNWRQYYNGEAAQSGEFDADKFYRAYGIKVD